MRTLYVSVMYFEIDMRRINIITESFLDTWNAREIEKK